MARTKQPSQERRFHVRPYYSHYGAEYLTHLANELGRLGFGTDSLTAYLATIYRELEGWFDQQTSEGLSSLYDYRRLNFAALARRSSEYQRHPVPAYLPKPRISISAEVTSKGNLSVRWHPWQVTINYMETPLDEWAWCPGSDQYFNQRPEDELLFIRGVNMLRFWREDTETVKCIKITLMEALAAAFGGLQGRLKRHFDVQLLTKLTLKEATASSIGVWCGDDSWLRDDPKVPVGWNLVSTIDARRNFLEEFIANFERENGIDPLAFRQQCEPFCYDDGRVNSVRASRYFKKHGLNGMTAGTVDTLEKTLKEAESARIWRIALL